MDKGHDTGPAHVDLVRIPTLREFREDGLKIFIGERFKLLFKHQVSRAQAAIPPLFRSVSEESVRAERDVVVKPVDQAASNS
jgi:hypothetical protein